MDIRLDELTDREFDELNDAITLTITARRIMRRHGLDELDDVQFTRLCLRMWEEEKRRKKTVFTVVEVDDV